MRLTQGTFSYLPDLTDEEIAAQVSYAIRNGWAVSVEHCARPHPREVYWEMWGAPMFDLSDPAPALEEINACRRAHPDHYIRVGAYDASYGRQSTVLQFLVNRPANEPGFDLEREEGPGRAQRYRIRHRATA